jgi:hypothetical protein
MNGNHKIVHKSGLALAALVLAAIGLSGCIIEERGPGGRQGWHQNWDGDGDGPGWHGGWQGDGDWHRRH